MARLLAVSRHRMATDGEGVTTLVAFHGCPLDCKYCLNPDCKHGAERFRDVTPEALLNEVMIDNIYFLATGGGVTFGGGEPLIFAHFIEEFCLICDPQWKINIETALNVPTALLEQVAGRLDFLIIDIKDMNPRIYERYTGRDNGNVLANLRWLCDHDMQSKCRIRLPLIPEFNTPEDVGRSRAQLEAMGFADFNEFTYITDRKKLKL